MICWSIFFKMLRHTRKNSQTSLTFATRQLSEILLYLISVSPLLLVSFLCFVGSVFAQLLVPKSLAFSALKLAMLHTKYKQKEKLTINWSITFQQDHNSSLFVRTCTETYMRLKSAFLFVGSRAGIIWWKLQRQRDKWHRMYSYS